MTDEEKALLVQATAATALAREILATFTPMGHSGARSTVSAGLLGNWQQRAARGVSLDEVRFSEFTVLTMDPTELEPGDAVVALGEHEEDGCHCDVLVTVKRALP